MKSYIVLLIVCCFSVFCLATCPSMDATGDCIVTLEDFTVFAYQWLDEGAMPYSELDREHIAAMEGQMSTASIDGSDGNEFMPGTYFIYKTDEGRFGRFMVENYEPEGTYNMVIRWVTYNADGSVYTHGRRLVIRGTWSCDLDEGLETSSSTERDFLWNLLTSTTRRLDPKNGAKFKLIHRAEAPNDMVWVYIDEWAVAGHEVYMSKYETTNAQYCQFLNAALASGDITVSGNDIFGASGSNPGEDFAGEHYYYLNGSGYTDDGATNGGATRINYSGGVFSVDSGFENHPVTYVNYYGSAAFAGYYGYRLPTEWEWRAVADYDGSYTYGCGTTINNSIANYLGSIHPDGTTVVGAFGTYGYGLCDMAGNVYEWTESCYYSDCESGLRVYCGCYWLLDAAHCTVTYRGGANQLGCSYGIGFRPALDLN